MVRLHLRGNWGGGGIRITAMIPQRHTLLDSCKEKGEIFYGKIVCTRMFVNGGQCYLIAR